MRFYSNTITVNDSTGISFEPAQPLIKCLCCGQDDTITPCRDCVAYCGDNEPCKARGITKLRLRLATRLYAAVTRWIDPRKG